MAGWRDADAGPFAGPAGTGENDGRGPQQESGMGGGVGSFLAVKAEKRGTIVGQVGELPRKNGLQQGYREGMIRMRHGDGPEG